MKIIGRLISAEYREEHCNHSIDPHIECVPLSNSKLHLPGSFQAESGSSPLRFVIHGDA